MARKRTLRADEAQLWRRLARTVRPLQPEPPMPEDFSLPAESAEPDNGTRQKKQPGPTPRKSENQRRIVSTRPHPGPQPVTEAGDPRQARRVSRGRRPIEATLDLHGMTQDQAYVALSRFLHQARAVGYATVLVITGKGAPQDRRETGFSVSRGILRRRFLDWADGPFREHIASIRQSHQKHGGAGAFYVFLKKQSR